MNDFLKAALGAIVGFSLAQIVNLARLAYDHWRRPKLALEANEGALILSHSEQTESYEYRRVDHFGFSVRNIGRMPALELRCYLLKIEISEKDSDFKDIFNNSTTLRIFESSYKIYKGPTDQTLLSGASVQFYLARRYEDGDNVIYPAIDFSPDYFEEICQSANRYRFTIAAFAKNSEPVSKIIVIE